MATRTAHVRSPKPAAHSSASSSEPVDRVASFLEHADDSADVVQIWEKRGDGGWTYLPPPFEPADVRTIGLEQLVADRFGGGSYKARLRSRSSGQYGKSVIVTVAGAAKSNTERAAQLAPAVPVVAPASNTSPPSWLEKIVLPIGVTVATAFGTMLAKKILERPATDPLTLELIRSLRAANGNGGTPAAPVDPFAMMTQIMKLEEQLEERANARRGDAPSEDGFGSVLKETVPQLVTVLNRKLDLDERRMLRVGAGTGTRSATAPTTTTTAAPPAASEHTDMPSGDPLVDFMRQIPPIARMFLRDAAATDESPEINAAMVLEKLNDEAYDALPLLLARGDVVDVMVQVVPAWAPYRTWFAALVDAMRASLAEATATTEGPGASAAQGLELEPVETRDVA